MSEEKMIHFPTLEEIAAEALSKKVNGFHEKLASASFDAKEQKKIIDQVMAIIDLPGFGVNLDLAENVYRLIRVHGLKYLTPEFHSACIEKIFDKILEYKRTEHIYIERYFHTRKMPLETNEFIFRVMYDKFFRGNPISSYPKEALSKLKEALNDMLFSYPPDMQKYIVNYLKTRHNLGDLTIPDAKQNELSQAELISRVGNSPVFSTPSERRRGYEIYDMLGKLKPEEPLLLSTYNPEEHQDSDDEELTPIVPM